MGGAALKITFIGDIHGAWFNLLQLINEQPDERPIIQVGDLGLGFPELKESNGIFTQTGKVDHGPKLPARFHFIRGNHDNPAICKQSPNYLGDWGKFHNVFFISGAGSIDRPMRVEGVSWWPDEEMSMEELQQVIDAYIALKPLVVVSHTCPASIAPQVMPPGWALFKERTGQAMDRMLEAWKPRLWVFGHFHYPWRKVIDGTDFICVPQNQAITLNV